MKDSAEKVCCPHCEYRTPVRREFSNGNVRHGYSAMIAHIRKQHSSLAHKIPTVITMTPEEEHKETMEWAYRTHKPRTRDIIGSLWYVYIRQKISPPHYVKPKELIASAFEVGLIDYEEFESRMKEEDE